MPLMSRSDGVYLSKLPGFRKMFPFLMPTRTEAYMHHDQLLRMKKTLQVLDELNTGRTERRYTIFHVVLAAAVRSFAMRPDAHRFVAGRRIYQRRHIELSFVTKKELTDTAAETNVKLRFEPTDTLPQVAERVWAAVSDTKTSKSSKDEDITDTLTRLPRFLTRLIMWGWKVLDYFNLLPASEIKGDALYCSAYFANLGSIGLKAVQHHLFEWGTCPFFVVIGKLKKEVLVSDDGQIVVEDVVTSTFTLDERITDGVSYARVIGMVSNFIEDPTRLLEPPDPAALPDPFALV
ncbi:MAG: hypothetical protein A2289_02125 [Deltaproteobacteria bacterium RIFOXYA12_FULL_58_15]|nr:MAG: hypothetical protein A2289_02125 [Deltaproteobacteria bacterium RIFOXYA12_FULL_58_15]OGR14946.1 MAG: hypothetical protein A2341_16280 [Deltaproteobacteria bacterium RIFOXYB12_FULL_58_9]